MTTTVKVHVNGKYRATVQHMLDDKPYGDPVVIGPQEERSFTAYHGHSNSFNITEEAVKDDEQPAGEPAPSQGDDTKIA